MGLDMYLEKCNRKMFGYRNIDVEEIKTTKPELFKEVEPYVIERGEYCKWLSLFEEVGYWRKANAIHQWFVDKVQNGVDNCGQYEVEKEQIEELLKICEEVIAHPHKAEFLLPTQSGFFFGSTEYDEWYFEDIKHTIEMLKKVLEETDFDREMITYQSSW